MPAATGAAPVSAETMLRVRQALDQHLPLPKGTAAASGRLGDLDEGDSLYEDIFGSVPGRAAELQHFEARRQATREAAGAQAAALSDDELYDQLYPPSQHD